MRKQRNKFEDTLERMFAIVCRSKGCMYLKIPDTKMINANNRHNHHESKRPFDGVLATPTGNYCVECKVDNNKLSLHQEANQQVINKINDSFLVLRWKQKLKPSVFQIERHNKVVFGSEDIVEVVEWIKEIKERKQW